MRKISTAELMKMEFVTSSLCANGECVEVAWLKDGAVVVRDAKDRIQQPLVFTSAEWTAFIGGVKAGEFDTNPHTAEPTSSTP